MTSQTPVTWDDFARLDLRVGTIVDAEVFPEARRPAYRLKVDFAGEVGVLPSSDQLTALYEPAMLVGRQVVAVVNLVKGAHNWVSDRGRRCARCAGPARPQWNSSELNSHCPSGMSRQLGRSNGGDSMSSHICPRCGHDPTLGKVAGGALKGAGAVIAGLVNPIFGVLALTGLAAKAAVDYSKDTVECPKCGQSRPA